MLQFTHQKTEDKMKFLKLILLLLCVVCFINGCAKATKPTIDNPNNPQVSPNSQPTLQSPLQSQPTLQGMSKRIIIAKNNSTFDANSYPNTLYLTIIFNNNVLVGGIFDDGGAKCLQKS